MGASILGANELYAKLKAFKSQLSGPNGAKKLSVYIRSCAILRHSAERRHPQYRPQLYFVKLDVQACFDTITQAKLIQILRDIISEVRKIGLWQESLLTHGHCRMHT